MIPSVAAVEGAWREPPAPQPGARPPAPGDLALVQSFINSHYDLEVEHGADLFATPDALAEWLTSRGLLEKTERVLLERTTSVPLERTTSIPLQGARPNNSLIEADVGRAIAVREGLRALARANADPVPAGLADARSALNEAARGAAVELRFLDPGPRFVASAATGLERALGVVLAVAASAMIEGSWARLKVCPGEDCGWAFYDHSRNQSGRWCSMAVCGGRAKARGYYRRRRGAG